MTTKGSVVEVVPDTDPTLVGAVEAPECALCGSREAKTLFVARDRLIGHPGVFPVVQCVGCGLVFLRPRPAGAALSAYYPDVYYPLDSRPSREAVEVARGVLVRVTEWARQQGLDQPRMLDVGCGTGLFLHLAQQSGMQVRGIELSPPAVEFGRKCYDLDIHCGTLSDADLPDESFDIVTLWHVLEHLPDPVAALRRVTRALAPGGLLLLAVPNFGSIEARFFGRRWYSLDVPRHLYHFTPRTLVATLTAAGLGVERVIHSSGTAGLVYSLMGDLTGILLKIGNESMSDSTYHRVARVLQVVARPFCAGAARLGRGGALEVYATKGLSRE